MYNVIVGPKSIHIVHMCDDIKCLYDTDGIEKNTEREREYTFVNKSSAWIYRKEKLPSMDTCKQYEKCELPKEMIKMKKGSSDYGLYMAKYERKKGKWVIKFEAAYFVQLFVNGQLKGTCKFPLWEDMWENR